MELLWKYERMSFIPFLKSSILASSTFHNKISVPFHFRSIPFPFHFIPCSGCRFYLIIIIIVTFYPNGCSQFENPEAPDFEKIASASSSFSPLLLPSLLPLSTSSIKVLSLPQKINRFHRFQLPLPLPHPWFKQFKRRLS